MMGAPIARRNPDLRRSPATRLPVPFRTAWVSARRPTAARGEAKWRAAAARGVGAACARAHCRAAASAPPWPPGTPYERGTGRPSRPGLPWGRAKAFFPDRLERTRLASSTIARSPSETIWWWRLGAPRDRAPGGGHPRGRDDRGRRPHCHRRGGSRPARHPSPGTWRGRRSGEACPRLSAPGWPSRRRCSP